MNDFIVSNFWDIHPHLKKSVFSSNEFNNDDSVLRKESNDIIFKRTKLELNKLVKGLQCILINAEEDYFNNTIDEFLMYTGYTINEAFENNSLNMNVLKLGNSSDIIVSTRKEKDNPFIKYNLNPKSEIRPNTRIECFIFEVTNIRKYFTIQKNRGINFLSSEIIEHDNYFFVQTIPSSFTGTSYGFIQWKGNKRNYRDASDIELSRKTSFSKPEYTKNIGFVDHAATRIIAKHRDAAILELMELTDYNFDFSIYVKNLNSITNVARMKGQQFAMVFTSGITPFTDLEQSGPTEKFVYNYGPRVHHIAFYTENIEKTFEELKNNNMKFLINLVGSEEEGIKQTFSHPSPSTFVVNEYICRYGDFDGFFTSDNVRDLTKATDKQ